MAKLKRRWIEPRGKPAGFVTVRRATDIAQCSEATIRRLVRRNGVAVVRWRSRVLVRERDLRTWLKAKPYEPAKQGPVYAKAKPPASEFSAESSTAVEAT
jgi:hypothetical protein